MRLLKSHKEMNACLILVKMEVLVMKGSMAIPVCALWVSKVSIVDLMKLMILVFQILVMLEPFVRKMTQFQLDMFAKVAFSQKKQMTSNKLRYS